MPRPPTRARNTRGELGRPGATPGSPGLAFPEAYGGQGGGILAHAIAVEEVARVCASSSLFTFISKLGMTPVLDHGSEALKEKYVTRVAAGECQASYCLSEADAGSDVAGMRTRAVRDGDHYVLDGSQALDHQRGRVRLLHRVRQDRSRRPGIAASAASSSSRAFPGFSIGKLERKLGVRGSPTGEVVAR